MKNNGNRVVASMINRVSKVSQKKEVTSHMQYSNGAWNDSHRG